MDSTFHALGEILLKGLPTFFLLILLNQFLKHVFFKPLAATLAARYDVTEGARKSAADALTAAEQRIAEYEATLASARAEMYAEQEAANKRLRDDQSLAIEKARQHAAEFVLRAKADLAAESEQALSTLAAHSEELADRIADSILIKGRAA